MSKSKFKLFVENILVYGFGGIISKIVPLIMVPILAYIFPDTSIFGIADNANLVLSFGSAIAIMGMYDAMYRLFFEKEDETFKKEVCSTTVVFTIAMSIIVAILSYVLRVPIMQIAFKSQEYSYLMVVISCTILVSSTNGIISAPIRMQNKRTVFLVANTISPILSYSIALILILNGYYIIALPLGALISGFIMEIAFLIMNRKWFDIKLFRKDLLKPLLVIALPLLPNFLVYWVFGSFDKLMITHYWGLGANGVYSAGSKLGMCSQLIYTAFAGGWQFFAFSTMKEKDQVKNNSAVFEYLGAVSFVASIFVCSISTLVYKVFFPIAYYQAYIVAPYLFLAPLLLMLFQVACNQLIVIKKTWPNVLILSSGAILNVVLNYYLIPRLGIEGAAVSTLIGYAFTDIIVCLVLFKMKLMVLSTRFYMMTGGLCVAFICWRLIYSDLALIGILAALAYMLFVMILYKKELLILSDKIKSLKKVHDDQIKEA